MADGTVKLLVAELDALESALPESTRQLVDRARNSVHGTTPRQEESRAALAGERVNGLAAGAYLLEKARVEAWGTLDAGLDARLGAVAEALRRQSRGR